MTQDEWSCASCTYHHETPKERQFLSCAVCGTRKQQANKSQKSTGTSGSLSLSNNNAASTATTSSKSNGILSFFQRETSSAKKPKLSSKSPVNQNKKRKLSGSQIPLSESNHATTCSNSETHESKSQPAVPNTEEPPPRRRSILDALKPCRASSFLPPARYRDSPQEEWRTIDFHQIATLAPMTVVRDVLPSKVANQLLQQLELESQNWNRGNWIVHGKEHKIPRTTATYQLMEEEEEEEEEGTDGMNDNEVKATKSLLSIADDEEEEYHDNRHQCRTISPEFRQAADRISELVQKHCPWTASADEGGMRWEPTFALANRYANGQECVGWHSDHITPLGPRPIIVGLSLGACRRFELRQPPPSSKEKSTNASTPLRTKYRHVSVPLPHNSIAIMWNDAQESWQHCVPRCSGDKSDTFMAHPTFGSVRISLTFRRQLRTLPDLGNCDCGRPVGLKAKDGVYFTFCRPYGKDKHKTCSFWKRCSWAEQEAQRMIKLEKAAAQGVK